MSFTTLEQHEEKDWRETLRELLDCCDTLEKGDLKQILSLVSEEYGLAYHTVRNFYYRYLYGRPNIKAEVREHTRRRGSMVEQATKPALPPYEIGKEVEVEVVNIREYGAFVRILDEYQLQALLHISEISRSFISDINEVMKVKDRFTARIVKVDADTGKISVSTKGMHPFDPVPGNATPTTEAPAPITKVQTKARVVSDSEMSDLVRFLRGVVGIVSPKAKDRMLRLIEEHGMVKYTMALYSVVQTFSNDLGLHLMEEVARKIGNCLDVEYVVNQHANEKLSERHPNLKDKSIAEMCHNGKIIIDFEQHRYIQYGSAVFPCVRIGERKYLVKTTLDEAMIRGREEVIVATYGR